METVAAAIRQHPLRVLHATAAWSHPTFDPQQPLEIEVVLGNIGRLPLEMGNPLDTAITGWNGLRLVINDARGEEHATDLTYGDTHSHQCPTSLAEAATLGWERCPLLAVLGQRAAMDVLPRIMHAGASFQRVTGADVERPERVALVTPGAEPDDFADEIKACEAARAQAAWGPLSTRPAPGICWPREIHLDAIADTTWPPASDLELRWAAHLRRAHTTAAPVILDHAYFPFRWLRRAGWTAEPGVAGELTHCLYSVFTAHAPPGLPVVFSPLYPWVRQAPARRRFRCPGSSTAARPHGWAPAFFRDSSRPPPGDTAS